MAFKAEKQPVIKTRGSAPRRYLYFEQPPELWIAGNKGEGHKEILRQSGRRNPVMAGWILATSGEAKVDAAGSLDLQIPTRHPGAVCGHIRSLPGKTSQKVTETVI